MFFFSLCALHLHSVLYAQAASLKMLSKPSLRQKCKHLLPYGRLQILMIKNGTNVRSIKKSQRNNDGRKMSSLQVTLKADLVTA